MKAGPECQVCKSYIGHVFHVGELVLVLCGNCVPRVREILKAHVRRKQEYAERQVAKRKP